MSKEFRKLYGEQYIKLVEKLPQLWSYPVFEVRPAEPRFAGRQAQARRREAQHAQAGRRDRERLAPDAILCTHFLPAELLSRQKAAREGGRSSRRCGSQVTDFDVHALWVHPHVDRYCVASEEVAFRLADRGVPREKISVTGIPVMPQFTAPLDRATCARELGIAPDRFTVLMMAGGAGVGGLDELAERVLRLPAAAQLVALAGRNAELLKRLQTLAKRHPGRLFPLGFTTTVERVMTAADLVVTKPGGLSVSECLAKQRPMLLVSPIPGQEERNADYLLEAGAAIKAVDGATLEFKLAGCSPSPARLAAMSEAAAQHRPAAMRPRT